MARKPDTSVAMAQLLDRIEQELPLYAPEASLCQKICVGCPKKLMQYLQGEFEYWRDALTEGVQPSFGDLQKLARSSRKIQAVLAKNNLSEQASGNRL